jgi:excisionase family DNA binding protein
LLNRLGKRTAKGHSWTRNRVCCFRNDHDIPVYIEGERRARGELTLHEAAEALGVSPMTVRRLIKRKLLPAEQVCVGAPWVIHADDLKRQAVQEALRGAPLTVNDKQQSLDFQ